MNKSLLEKAKEIPTGRRKLPSEITTEDVELAVSYLKGELTMHQVAVVLGYEGATVGNIYPYITRAIRYGFVLGLISFSKKKDLKT